MFSVLFPSVVVEWLAAQFNGAQLMMLMSNPEVYLVYLGTLTSTDGKG